jgi:hypothetical protein
MQVQDGTPAEPGSVDQAMGYIRNRGRGQGRIQPEKALHEDFLGTAGRAT